MNKRYNGEVIGIIICVYCFLCLSLLMLYVIQVKNVTLELEQECEELCINNGEIFYKIKTGHYNDVCLCKQTDGRIVDYLIG